MRDVVDLHTHTLMSGHAYNTIYEMAKTAADRGAELLGISDHGPAMDGAPCSNYFRASGCVPDDVYGVRLLFGCELNILDYDGKVDLEESFARPLDYAIASLHDVCITPGSRAENTRAYLKAMENPKVFIIGHPDDGTFAVDYDLLCREAAKNRVLIELNEASVVPNSHRPNAPLNAREVMKRCEKYGTRITLTSDAHTERNVLKHDCAKRLLEELRFPEELVLNRDPALVLAALSERTALF